MFDEVKFEVDRILTFPEEPTSFDSTELPNVLSGTYVRNVSLSGDIHFIVQEDDPYYTVTFFVQIDGVSYILCKEVNIMTPDIFDYVFDSRNDVKFLDYVQSIADVMEGII